MPATVILDILSGLPNPQWDLAPELAKKICDYVIGARPVQHMQPGPVPGLGYRGLLVTLPDCQAVETTMRVFNGFIELDDTIVRDEGKHIEHLLLDSADDSVNSTLIEEASKALN